MGDGPHLCAECARNKARYGDTSKPVVSPPPKAPPLPPPQVTGYISIPTMEVFKLIRLMKQQGLDATAEYNALWHYVAECLNVNEVELRQFVYGE